MLSDLRMSSSESDHSDGAEAPLDFDKIDRIRESVTFDDCVEQLGRQSFKKNGEKVQKFTLDRNPLTDFSIIEPCSQNKNEGMDR